jgi:FtsZ-interacting cell division protein YlmF
VDFLSGVTYANHGDLKQVSKETFLLVPNGVDMMGELFFGGLDDSASMLF